MSVNIKLVQHKLRSFSINQPQPTPWHARGKKSEVHDANNTEHTMQHQDRLGQVTRPKPTIMPEGNTIHNTTNVQHQHQTTTSIHVTTVTNQESTHEIQWINLHILQQTANCRKTVWHLPTSSG